MGCTGLGHLSCGGPPSSVCSSACQCFHTLTNLFTYSYLFWYLQKTSSQDKANFFSILAIVPKCHKWDWVHPACLELLAAIVWHIESQQWDCLSEETRPRLLELHRRHLACMLLYRLPCSYRYYHLLSYADASRVRTVLSTIMLTMHQETCAGQTLVWQSPICSRSHQRTLQHSDWPSLRARIASPPKGR